jgi:hypothetical protein
MLKGDRDMTQWRAGMNMNELRVHFGVNAFHHNLKPIETKTSSLN